MDLQNHFTRRITINANVSKVFDAWTLQGGMEDWMLRTAKFSRKNKPLPQAERIQQGDEFEWTWHGWPDHLHSGVVLNVVKDKLYSFTFDPAGQVDLTFESRGEVQTDLILKQSDVPIQGQDWYEYFYGCSLGWSFWMVNLKAWLEHGISLDEQEIIYDNETRYEIVNQ